MSGLAKTPSARSLSLPRAAWSICRGRLAWGNVALSSAAAICLTVASGCASAPQVVTTEGKEVSKAVAVKCIERTDVPATPKFPLDVVDLSDQKTALARLTNAARLERKVRAAYVAEVQKVFDKCSE